MTASTFRIPSICPWRGPNPRNLSAFRLVGEELSTWLKAKLFIWPRHYGFSLHPLGARDIVIAPWEPKQTTFAPNGTLTFTVNSFRAILDEKVTKCRPCTAAPFLRSSSLESR